MEFNGQYLTYGEYQELGGTLGEMPFKILELKARKIIDNATFNRLVDLKKQIDEVKACIYELINQIQEQEKNSNIVSENTDGYVVTYNKTSQSEINQVYYCIVRNYLLSCKLADGTPYMYCGVE